MSQNLYPDSIHVDLDYYDSNEEMALKKYPSSKQLEISVKEGIDIPTSDFLEYFLFKYKKTGNKLYINQEVIKENIQKALTFFEGFIEFSDHSIHTCQPISKQDLDISKGIGEGIGLAVINHIHGLTGADWNPIPENGGSNAIKIFDYSFVSDGERIIQVECKGSSVEDNRKKDKRIYQHKSNIKEKKEKIKEAEVSEEYPFPATIRYGTITALDSRLDGNAKCWLLDPIPQPISTQPKNYRLYARMNFIYQWISLISPRSQLASSLRTRIAALITLENPFELDGTPLYRGNGNVFYDSLDVLSEQKYSFFQNKTQIVDESSGGIFFKLTENELFFMGIVEELISLVSYQKFDEILKSKFQAKTQKKTVKFLISKKQFEKMDLQAGTKSPFFVMST